MGNPAIIEILFWAVVAVFLVLRLRATLGSRTGYEKRPEDIMAARRERDAQRQKEKETSTQADPSGPQKSGPQKVVSLEARRTGAEQTAPEPPGARASQPEITALHHGKLCQKPLEVNSPLSQGLSALRTKDRHFSSADFLQGAGTAFEMILTAFAEGDRATLKNLLSAEVFNNFDQSITAREQAGHQLDSTLVALSGAEIIAIELQDHRALITVCFISEQITVTRDRDSEIVDGDPGKVSQITDNWSFARDLRSSNPNWELVETHTAH